jgi:colanic acid/amylovoran biosynthesis glycosyltransferase
MADDPPVRLDDRPVVAMFRAPLFNASEGFIQTQAAALDRHQPLMVGLNRLGHIVPALAGRTMVADGAGTRLAIRLLGRWGELGARVAAHRPVLVHAHFAPDGLAALPLARTLGVPLITSLRGYDVTRSRSALLSSGRLSWMRYAAGGRALKQAGDLFLAVSDALRHRAIGAGFPEERTLTHYNGVDLDRFRPGAESAEPGLILFVGRLVEKKGVAVLLDAFATVKAAVPAARLLIIGDGPLAPSLKRRANALGVGDSVDFAGALSAEEVARDMRRAWLLAVPSLTARDGDSEGLPNTLVEAAASGLPVVATDHGGIPEAVEDGRSGFLVPEAEPEPLARRIVELLQSPDRRHDMARAARSLAEVRFDLVRQTERLEAIYDRVRGA